MIRQNRANSWVPNHLTMNAFVSFGQASDQIGWKQISFKRISIQFSYCAFLVNFLCVDCSLACIIVNIHGTHTHMDIFCLSLARSLRFVNLNAKQTNIAINNSDLFSTFVGSLFTAFFSFSSCRNLYCFLSVSCSCSPSLSDVLVVPFS